MAIYPKDGHRGINDVNNGIVINQIMEDDSETGFVFDNDTTSVYDVRGRKSIQVILTKDNGQAMTFEVSATNDEFDSVEELTESAFDLIEEGDKEMGSAVTRIMPISGDLTDIGDTSPIGVAVTGWTNITAIMIQQKKGNAGADTPVNVRVIARVK